MQKLGYAKVVGAIAGALALSSCATIEGDDPELDQVEQAVTGCTAISMVTPVNGQVGQVGVPMTMLATATCSGPHEFEYWVKVTSVGNWTRLGGGTVFVPGSFDWTPPSAGPWNVTAVVRTVGTAGYEKRASTLTVSISAAPPPNQPPVANPDSRSTPHGVALTFDPRVNDTDPESSALTITNAGNGTNGGVTFTGTSVTYTPNPTFFGQDSFSYTISDGSLTATSTVTVDVTDNAPDAVDDSNAGHTGAAITGNVLTNDSDPDSDALTVTAFTQPANGTVTVAPDGSYQYTSSPAFTGVDTFTYTIGDGFGGSDTATVSITLSNTAPVATTDVVSVLQNGSTTGNVLTNDTDADNDTLTVTGNGNAGHGTASVAPNGAFTYTPTIGYSGPDSFTYDISDGAGGTATGTVSITVTALTPNCNISISGPSVATWGVPFTLTATASCTTGPAELRWFKKVTGKSNVQIQGYATTLTLDQTLTSFDGVTYTAEVRTVGTTTPTTVSAPISLTVQDSVASCTAVRLTSPTPGATLTAGSVATLTATSTCPGTPEYQYWYKPSTQGNWIFIPGYVPGSQSWNVPLTTGLYDLTVVVRVVGAHQLYQVRANSVRITVAP